MVTLILAIAVLAALTGLGLEIGIVSWSIRRANRYRRRADAAERTTTMIESKREDTIERMEILDEYASKVSWLLNFLYNRYGKFTDLEKEVEEGLKGVTGDTLIGEAEAKYKDLKKALKIIKITVRASERMENLMNSISSQLSQIMEDFEDEDDDPEPETDKPSEAKADGEDTVTPNLETPEGKAPDVEGPNS
jgi:hypothetical protein